MSAWASLPWSSALCFVLAGVVAICVLFLIWDAWKHREPRRTYTDGNGFRTIHHRHYRTWK